MPQSGLVRQLPPAARLTKTGPLAGVWLSAPGSSVGSVAHGPGAGAAHPLYVGRRIITDVGFRIDAGGATRTAEVALWEPDPRTSMPERQIFYRSGLDASAAAFIIISGLAVRAPSDWLWAGVAGVGGAVTFWNIGSTTVGDWPLSSIGGTATNPGSSTTYPDFSGLGVFGDWRNRGQVTLGSASVSRVYVKVSA